MISILIKKTKTKTKTPHTFKYHLYALICLFIVYFLFICLLKIRLDDLNGLSKSSRILLFYLNAISEKLFATKSFFFSEFQIVKEFINNENDFLKQKLVEQIPLTLR